MKDPYLKNAREMYTKCHQSKKICAECVFDFWNPQIVPSQL